jgi:hypothetical protein
MKSNIILRTLALAAVLCSPAVMKAQPGNGNGNGNAGSDKKITICHIPPGNPDNAHTITIDKSAWPAHQKHGDYVGACRKDTTIDTTTQYPSPCNEGCMVGNAKAAAITYKVDGKVVPSLVGHVKPGATVEVTFNTANGTDPTRFTLVSYYAPAPVFSQATANQQVIFDVDNEILGPGTHTLKVKVPSCNFQVDFVKGCEIQVLGPVGTNNFYSSQGRLIASVNGGGKVCQVPCSIGNAKIQGVSYTIDGKKYSSLGGHVKQGSIVEVSFNTPQNSSATRLSLVSYQAPSGNFDGNTAYLQTVYDSSTGVFGPGCHTLKVRIPNCYYQVDFVYGCIIDHLGPEGSNNFYSPQHRLIDHDNGGTAACVVDTTACDTCEGTGGFPVKLVKFEAKKMSPQVVVLNWTTASETNNDYIAIEKSTDVQNWSEVCRVPGAPGGNSQTTRNYSCTDNHADESGQNNVYYRPKQVDFNGTYEYYNMIRVRLQDATAENSVGNAYPNPATDRIHIAYNASENSQFNIRLISMDGRVLLYNKYVAQPGSQIVDLDLPETTLKTGFYILEVQSDDQVFRQKVYKQ